MAIPAGISLPSTQGGDADLAERRDAGDRWSPTSTRAPASPASRCLPAGTTSPAPAAARRRAAPTATASPSSARSAPRCVGISAQSQAEQAEFAAREHIPFPLLADPGLELAAALGLPTFEAAGHDPLPAPDPGRPRGRMVKAFYPVFPPDRNAAEVLDWLRTGDRP